jgi:hypothetical protein
MGHAYRGGDGDCRSILVITVLLHRRVVEGLTFRAVKQGFRGLKIVLCRPTNRPVVLASLIRRAGIVRMTEAVLCGAASSHTSSDQAALFHQSNFLCCHGLAEIPSQPRFSASIAAGFEFATRWPVGDDFSITRVMARLSLQRFVRRRAKRWP